MSGWIWRIVMGAALLSGLLTLALLMLPLLLVLLMVLFDTTAQGLLVLLGLIATWLQTLMPSGGGGLPPYRAIALDPLDVGLRAAARSLPCLAGLVLILATPRPGPRWWWVALLWTVTAIAGGQAVAVAIGPGILSAILLALPFWMRRSR